MQINVEDYEKLGAFYLGRDYDIKNKKLKSQLTLYNSRDLVTHGVVLGMTGSGKTGLCISLLEEAAMDNIPAIIIDPKGDIANLLLSFPELKPKDFEPWINEDDARKKGISPAEHAENQASLWKNGLAKWGQSTQRIKEFRQKVSLNIFTPGSNAGLPVSILSSLDAPDFEIIDDAELLGDRIESTVTSLLSLLGIDADPIQSKEHILLSQIFNFSWQAEKNLTLETLVAQIQSPPFNKIGVLGLESFYPEKSRFELAMKMNSLLAAPGFSVWLEGVPLNIQNMLYSKNGKPQISIFSISHLSDTERMFFVSLLLNQMLSWMRAQSGTSSLRALLYMDEIFGYLPPTGNPPSKKPLMTILKQARAFGLGALLATQNPVDLDYKALSNIGTWFLGRLQTERDKMRVLDGLQGAASAQGEQLKRSDIEKILSGLKSRVFLLNNVHQGAPKTFQVRWVMSYLRGPLTRRQIRSLMKVKREKLLSENSQNQNNENVIEPKKLKTAAAPIIPNSIEQVFLQALNLPPGKQIYYIPTILLSAEIKFDNAQKNIFGTKKNINLCKINADDKNPDWSQSFEFKGKNAQLLPQAQTDAAHFGALPGFALTAKNYPGFAKEYIDCLYNNFSLKLMRSPSLGICSNPGETEGEFRARLQHSAHQNRDKIIDKTQEKFEKLINRLEVKIERAAQKVETQKAQARQAKLSTAISIGSSILGSLFGGRKPSLSTAGRGASRAWKESRDVTLAEREMQRLQTDLTDLEQQMQNEIKEIERKTDPMNEQFEQQKISPLKKNIKKAKASLCWLPFYREGEFGLNKAW